MKKFLISLFCILMLAGCASGRKEAEYYVNDGGNYGGDFAYEQPVSSNKSEQAQSEEKIVYTGDVVFESRQYDEFVKQLNAAIASYKGVSQSLKEYGEASRTMYLTVRIPAESFDQFINELRNTSGSVVSISVYSDNITRQYNETSIEIEALKTQHTRLLQLLEKAESLTDIIALEDRLSQVETRLTILENSRNDMDARVSYSTITITVREVTTYTEATFLERLKDAFVGSGENFVRGLQNFIINLIYSLPMIILAVVVILVARKPLIRLVKKIRLPEKKKNSDDRGNDPQQ